MRAHLEVACLARPLVVRPRYLICDELSSMLDVPRVASAEAGKRLPASASAAMCHGSGVFVVVDVLETRLVHVRMGM